MNKLDIILEEIVLSRNLTSLKISSVAFLVEQICFLNSSDNLLYIKKMSYVIKSGDYVTFVANFRRSDCRIYMTYDF